MFLFLQGELTLLEKIAPGNRPVYVSSDWAECEKMLVIVTKSDCIPGVWDNDALLTGGLDIGSMFPYFQKAVYQVGNPVLFLVIISTDILFHIRDLACWCSTRFL